MIKKIAIVGSGAMGSGITQISLMGGYHVTLVDIKDDYIDSGIKKIQTGLEKLESKKKLKNSTATQLISQIEKTTDLIKAVKKADLIVETVTEDLAIKEEVFKTAGKMLQLIVF